MFESFREFASQTFQENAAIASKRWRSKIRKHSLKTLEDTEDSPGIQEIAGTLRNFRANKNQSFKISRIYSLFERPTFSMILKFQNHDT